MAIHNNVKDKGMTFMSIKNISPVTMFRWDILEASDWSEY